MEDIPRGHSLRRGRVSEPGRIYHITTVTHERKRLFSNLSSGRLIVQCFQHLNHSNRAKTLAFVVMPDHVHWLFELGENEDLSTLVASFKGYAGKQLATNGNPPPIWQQGFHDHALRKEEDLEKVARYIVANPLRSGLVSNIGDYPLWDAIWL